MQQWTVIKDVSEIRSCTEEEYQAKLAKVEATLKQAVDRYTTRTTRSLINSNEMMHDDRRLRTHNE